MRILLDTHIYLWCIDDNHKCLSKSVRNIILNADQVYVSSVSIWEAAIKIKLGKLKADIHALIDAIDTSGFLELPLLMKHVVEVSRLPDLHKDPFDRILIAQAISEPLRFLTADETLKDYSDIIDLI